jgi:hypothetical protein
MVREYSIILTTLGNGCGYNSTTLDYPYLYWPAPDISALESGDELGAFKYAMCVKSCPSNDTSTAVLCKQPSKYFNQTSKFKDCMYYPYNFTSPLRYNTVAGN